MADRPWKSRPGEEGLTVRLPRAVRVALMVEATERSVALDERVSVTGLVRWMLVDWHEAKRAAATGRAR